MTTNELPIRVYLGDELIAACKHYEDAAVLAAATSSGIEVKQSGTLLWAEGNEEFSAAESYDRAAEVMRARNERRIQTTLANQELRLRGCRYYKNGWHQDGVLLAADAIEALRLLEGN